MKTSILTLALALAFSFTATPANAKVSAKQKCDAGKQTATAKHLQWQSRWAASMSAATSAVSR